MAEAEGGSEQDDVSFLRTVSLDMNTIYLKLYSINCYWLS